MRYKEGETATAMALPNPRFPLSVPTMTSASRHVWDGHRNVLTAYLAQWNTESSELLWTYVDNEELGISAVTTIK